MSSSGLTVASKSLNRAIEPSEVSSIVHPETNEDSDVLKAKVATSVNNYFSRPR